MPELPEVETVRRDLEPALAGRRIDAVAIGRDRAVRRQSHAEFIARLTGRQINGVRRHGKFLIVDLDDDECVVGHLRMSGQLRMASPADELVKHTHVVVKLDNATELRFVDPRTFGEMFVDELGRDGRPHSLVHLGPDALTRMRAVTFRDRVVGGRRLANVKSALLDQTTIAGVGNIYADESLFAAGISPQRLAASITLDEAAKLQRHVGRILRAAIRARGTTFADFAYVDAYGRRGGFTPKVYGREGKPCVRCRAPVVKLVVAQRGTHVCPACQPCAS